jgi:hypothetical protein
MTAKKEGLKKTWALVVVKVIRTSRGEQLMRWRGRRSHQECISCILIWEAKYRLSIADCDFRHGSLVFKQ